MYNFFKKHPEFTLIGLAVLFLIIIAASFLWGIGNLVVELNESTGVIDGEAGVVESFDLSGARGLDLKGALR